jgi:hypothetical protein
MRVMVPSTCGLMLAESRDFRVETYSDESVIGFEDTGTTFTAIAGGGPWGPWVFPPLQPLSSAAAENAAIANLQFAFNTLINLVSSSC